MILSFSFFHKEHIAMKYALIGCGRISPNHLGSALDHSLTITAVCDLDPQ